MMNGTRAQQSRLALNGNHRSWLSRAWFLWLALLSVSCVASAQSADEIEIAGKRYSVDSRSIKCDSTAKDFPTYINTERLANCGSAAIITFVNKPDVEHLFQFTINPDDKKIFGGVRAELADTRISKNGETTWYRISTLIPDGFPMDAQHRLVLAQWHELDQPGKPFHRPPLSHRLWNKEFAVELFNRQIIAKLGDEHDGQVLYSAPGLETGLFYEYAYKIGWAPDDSGSIRAWHRKCPEADLSKCTTDWEQFIDYSGSTGYLNAAVEGYYFKYGLYTTTDFNTSYTAYHANYKSGETAADVGLTDPMFR